MDIHLQVLALSVKERALYADEAEWATLVDAFKALTPEHRILVWTEATKGYDIKRKDVMCQAKLIHKHLAELVLDCFR